MMRSWKPKTLASLVLGILLLLGGVVEAATKLVAPGGSVGNLGTRQAPFAP